MKAVVGRHGKAGLKTEVLAKEAWDVNILRVEL